MEHQFEFPKIDHDMKEAEPIKETTHHSPIIYEQKELTNPLQYSKTVHIPSSEVRKI